MSGEIEVDRLREAALGRELDEDQGARLAARMEPIQVADGDVLVREGDDDPRLFLLVRGRLEVVTDRYGEQAVVHVMRPGECAGTRAFIDRAPRQATLRASGDSEVYALSPEEFESLIESDPWVVYKIMRAIFRTTHRNLLRMNTEANELENYVRKVHGRY